MEGRSCAGHLHYLCGVEAARDFWWPPLSASLTALIAHSIVEVSLTVCLDDTSIALLLAGRQRGLRLFKFPVSCGEFVLLQASDLRCLFKSQKGVYCDWGLSAIDEPHAQTP